MILPFKHQLQGMTKLDRSKFLKILQIPYVKLPSKSLGRVLGLKSIKDYYAKNKDGLKYIMNSSVVGEKLLLFDPESLNLQVDDKSASSSYVDVRKTVLEDLKKVLGEQAPTDFFYMERSFTYEQWEAKSCIKAILPPPLEFSSFSQVGHIAQLNLREEVLPYRYAIAEIMHDKISWAKTVVNKIDKINTEFRLFDMELLAGEPNYVTEMTEKGVIYRMDFSKVFWNSRLSDVHENIVKQFNQKSVVFDVFCGIGPFVLPAVKHKKIKKAFANDLNPVSVEYLKENIALNKVPEDCISTYAIDGADFIRNVVSMEFLKYATDASSESGLNFHVVMNLPSISVNFLPHFKGFLNKHPESRFMFKSVPFYIHCHFFVVALRDSETKGWFSAEAVRIVKKIMHQSDLQIHDVRYLRQVAGRKSMCCVSFQLPQEYAFTKHQLQQEQPKNDFQITEQSDIEGMRASKRNLLESVYPNEEVVGKIKKI